MSSKTFSNKSNAARAARKAGLDPSTLTYHTDEAGKVTYSGGSPMKKPKPPKKEKVAKNPRQRDADGNGIRKHVPKVGQTASIIHPRKGKTGEAMKKLLSMLTRKSGASVAEIVAETGWKPHTTRARISVNAGKMLGNTIVTEKHETRGRIYRIAA